MPGTLGPGIGYGKASRFMYIATAAQVTFSGADSSAQALTMTYTPGYVEVIVNGKWLPPQDYTATNGSAVVLNSGCIAGDIVYVYVLSTFQLNLTPFPAPGALWGLTMSTAGSSTTLTVAKGSAADSTNTTMMQLAANMAKTTSAWAAGTGNGGLDTGAIAASTWYHWFLIFNPTTLAVDVVFSATATPANGPTTLPSGFTLFRRIGSAKTNGSSQWTKFFQQDDEFVWDAPAGDVNSASQSSTAALITLSVPSGVIVTANFLALDSATAAGGQILYTSPNVSTQVVNTPSGNISLYNEVGNLVDTGFFKLQTNTSSQIRAVSNGAAGLVHSIVTQGWTDTRGRSS